MPEKRVGDKTEFRTELPKHVHILKYIFDSAHKFAFSKNRNAQLEVNNKSLKAFKDQVKTLARTTKFGGRNLQSS